MKQSFKRLMSSVLALVFAIAAFVVYFNFVQPQYFRIMEMRGELASLTELVESQRAVLQTVQELVEKYEAASEERMQVSLALPTEPMSSEALAQIHGISAIHNIAAQAYILTVSGESGDRERSSGNFQPLPAKPLVFQVRSSGSYEDFKRFLGNLETNVRIFDVQSLGIQAAGKPNQNLYSFELRVAAYYQPEKK